MDRNQIRMTPIVTTGIICQKLSKLAAEVIAMITANIKNSIPAVAMVPETSDLLNHSLRGSQGLGADIADTTIAITKAPIPMIEIMLINSLVISAPTIQSVAKELLLGPVEKRFAMDQVLENEEYPADH